MSNLPYDAEIKYLQSTGTQIINTGISGGSNAEYSVTFMIMPDNAEWVHLCGSVRGEQGAPKIQHYGNTVNWCAEWYTNAAVSVDIFAYDGAIHTAEYKNGNLYVDGVVKANPGIYGFGSRNFCLFNYLAENIAGSKARLYKASVKLDGDVVRDFIPVRVGQVGYLYDKVSETLFGNSGTGDFIIGNDKALPNPFGFRRRLMVFDCVQLLNAVKIYKETSLGLPCTTPDFSITLDCFVPDNETFPYFFGINPYGNNSWRQNKLLIVAVGNSRARGIAVHINNSYKNQTSTKYFNVRSELKMDGWKVYKNNTQILDATSIRQGMMDGSEFNIFPSVEGDVNNNYIVVYGGIIYIEGTLMRHIYPAQKGNDIGLYDSVTGNFYASEGAVEYV